MDTGNTAFPAAGIKDFEFVLPCATGIYELSYALDQGVPVEGKGCGSPEASKTQLPSWSPRQGRLAAQVQYNVHSTAVLAMYS